MCYNFFTSSFFYQVIGLADKEEQAWSSADVSDAPVYFGRRELRYLSLVDEEPSVSMITDAKVTHVPGDDSVKVVALSGSGPVHSKLSVFGHGVQVSEMAVTELPIGTPTGVWTLKEKVSSLYIHLIVVAFPSATVVLSVGESVEESPGSPFYLAYSTTLFIGQLADDSYIQVKDKNDVLSQKQVKYGAALGATCMSMICLAFYATCMACKHFM